MLVPELFKEIYDTQLSSPTINTCPGAHPGPRPNKSVSGKAVLVPELFKEIYNSKVAVQNLIAAMRPRQSASGKTVLVPELFKEIYNGKVAVQNLIAAMRPRQSVSGKAVLVPELFKEIYNSKVAVAKPHCGNANSSNSNCPWCCRSTNGNATTPKC